ncbi:hypothetical protein SAMN05444266_106459 [Chitinophaga jiangningensis]|uniref:Uncharacterized protein n=1 Tax=Chitinophaga jiangningensis TaxID=1419482 RepID=A0A1M7G941_9BACT|nr:hypothetical protein SAMN05444266_106459 [Chitinophaga jiangningensis]
MKNVKPNGKPTPMPLPRPREEMHVFDQIIWDQRRIRHAIENGIPLSELSDINFFNLQITLSGHECIDDICRSMR